MKPRELTIQDSIRDNLNNRELYPYSVIFTYSQISGVVNEGDGVLAITFRFRFDLSDFLDLIDYKYQCDRGGYIIFWDSLTLILSGTALRNTLNIL